MWCPKCGGKGVGEGDVLVFAAVVVAVGDIES